MKEIVCNRGCDTAGLHWKYPDGKYKLFDRNDLLHVCEDGKIKPEVYRIKATESILEDTGIKEPAMIPLPHNGVTEVQIPIPKLIKKKNSKKSFTITTTATGIAMTGEDTNTAIYIPKVAVTDMIKALVDFV